MQCKLQWILIATCLLCLICMLTDVLRVNDSSDNIVHEREIEKAEIQKTDSVLKVVKNDTNITNKIKDDDLIIKTCPEKYLFTNTHTWGRHHNQLQSFLFSIVASKLMQRTFILGHFRHNHAWIESTLAYSWEEISKEYCVKLPSDTGITLRSSDIECFGQDLKETPFGKSRKLKCKKFNENAPRHFNRFIFQDVVPTAFKHAFKSNSKLVVLSGQIAFYLRPGLRLLKPVFSLLRPSPDVQREVSRMVNNVFGGKKFISVHVRAREGQCQEEIALDYSNPSTRMYNVSREVISTLASQCGITPAVLQEFRLKYKIESAFFASDHQNPSLDKSFLSVDAIPYKGSFHTNEIGGLCGLAVDYFILRSSHVFIGNTISSISQDVCYARLSSMPFSHACAGWDESLISDSLSVTQGYYNFLVQVGAVREKSSY